MLIALFAAAIDPPTVIALIEADRRLVTIGRRLAKGGADLCTGAASNPGWTVADIDQFDRAARSAVRIELGLGDWPTVVSVEPGSAAARAGARKGDQIAAVDGVQLPAATAKASRDRQQSFERTLATALARNAAAVRVRRDNRDVTLTLRPEPGCASEFVIGRRRGLRGASSDGTHVAVSAELLEFAGSDDELALVMAHEMAHNILGHNVGVPSFRRAGEDRSGRRARDREAEADRWALYLTARAGYDVSVAPGFWTRWGPRTDFGILGTGTHPGWRSRAARATEEIVRIRAQQLAGSAPIP